MTLYEVCEQIAIIEEQLACGEIEFVYDNLMSAMKPGHPADILDEVLSIIGWDVQAGKTPSLAKIKRTLKGLEDFQKAFSVDLSGPVSALKEYVKNNETT
jgi:hypothetical protein